MKQTISTRQCGIIMSLLLFANKILVLPSLLYENSKADGLFILLLLLAIEFGILMMFLKIKKVYPLLSFYDIITLHFGKIVAKIVYFLLFLYFFFKIMLIFNISYMYFHVQVYIDASYYIFIFIFMLAMTTSVLRGIRPLARGCEFFYLFIISCLIFSLFLSVANYKTFPLFIDSPPKNFAAGVFKYLFCFGDMMVIFVIMDKMEIEKNMVKKMIGFFCTSAVIILILCFMFYAAFGRTSFLYKNAISDIITFSYRFIDLGRLDIISILTVMFLSVLQLSLYCYALTECFMKVFSKLSRVYSIAVFDIAFFCIVVSSVVNYLEVVRIGESAVNYLAIFLQIVVPLIIFFISLKKRGKEDEKIY